jgi:nicotinamide mononucleotide transporter
LAFFILRWVNQGDAEYLDSYLPWIDSFNTSFFLVATILMAVKKVENWIFWIIGDIVSIPIFASQGLYFTSIQYTVFLVLAILGLREWRKKL